MKTNSTSFFGVQAAILSAIAAVIAGGFAFSFSWPLVALVVATLPLPLLVLWLATSVESPEERIAAVDRAAANARLAAPHREPQPVSRAA